MAASYRSNFNREMHDAQDVEVCAFGRLAALLRGKPDAHSSGSKDALLEMGQMSSKMEDQPLGEVEEARERIRLADMTSCGRPKSELWILDQFRFNMLRRFGVNMGVNHTTVLSYNPRVVQSGVNVLVVLLLLPRVFTRSLVLQGCGLLAVAYTYLNFFSDAGGPWDQNMTAFTDQLRGLTQFVLGLFVSLVLAKTYYANRGCFGSVFGCTMGFAQMVTAWVRAPKAVGAEAAEAGQRTACESRQLLVRWANAAFRLMVLEARDLTPQEIGDRLVARELLTTTEWKHIAGLKSRATHVYQWMNNVVHDLLDAGYIRDPIFVNKMNTQLDEMRGNNVWGLPSLPIMYTLLITFMVKSYLVLLACKFGGALNLTSCAEARKHFELVMTIWLNNFLFQGLLDLHEVLYSPNQGSEVSHLPADNFLNFVEQVTSDLVEKNADLPYTAFLPAGLRA